MELETRIQAVTVFTADARITRVGEANLAAGSHTLTVERLTTSIYPGSVRVSGRGAGVRLLGVDVRKVEYTETPEEDIRELEERQRALRMEVSRLTDERTVIEKRQAWLAEFGAQAAESLARAIGRGRAAPNDVGSVGDYISQQDADYYAHRRALTHELTEVETEIEAIERQLKRLRRGDRMTRYVVEIEVEAAHEATCTLELVYNVRGASWQPLYDLRLDEDDVTLTYLATVSQKTGEAWPDVALSLSTARPGRSTTLPELTPWPLREYQPPRPAAKRSRMPAPARLMGGAASMVMSEAAEEEELLDMDDDVPPPQAEVATATVEQGRSVTYHIGTPVWVEADGSERKTTITIERIDAALDYLVVPKLAEEAYLRATVTNSSAYLLLPGEASIYHGEEYVGKTRLKTTAPDETFEVQLGVDDGMRVDRELTTHDVSKPTLTSKRRIEMAYRVTLGNHTGRETRVMVMDHIPHSQHEDISVKLDSATPTPQEHTDLNLLTWEIPLQAGEEAELTYKFTVEHPRSMRIMGL